MGSPTKVLDMGFERTGQPRSRPSIPQNGKPVVRSTQTARSSRVVTSPTAMRPRRPTFGTDMVVATRPVARQSVVKPVSSNPISAQTAQRPKQQPLITGAPRNNVEKPVTKKHKNPILRYGFIGFGMIVFAFTLFVTIQTFVINKKVQDGGVLGASGNVDEQGVAQGDGDNPAEQKPNDRAYSAYNTSPDKPRYLRIPSIEVFARIKELGLTSKGAVDAPWNIHDVGWYNGSVTPGKNNGVSMLLGHVSGKTMPGVFKRIDTLSKGDTIEVELGDGRVLTYSVDKVEEYTVDTIDMKSILYEVAKGTKSLRLMTCGGSFNSATQQYLSRTVVYALPTSE